MSEWRKIRAGWWHRDGVGSVYLKSGETGWFGSNSAYPQDGVASFVGPFRWARSAMNALDLAMEKERESWNGQDSHQR